MSGKIHLQVLSRIIGSIPIIPNVSIRKPASDSVIGFVLLSHHQNSRVQ